MINIDGLLSKTKDNRLLFISETYHFRHLFVDKNDIIDNMKFGYGLTPIFIKAWFVENENGYIELTAESVHEELLVCIKDRNNTITLGTKPKDDMNRLVCCKFYITVLIFNKPCFNKYWC
jgi:hypothetical protein